MPNANSEKALPPVSAQQLCEVKADHSGWEAEVEQMDSNVRYLFRDLQRWTTRYETRGYDGRTLAVGYETWSPEVLKRARKLGWLE